MVFRTKSKSFKIYTSADHVTGVSHGARFSEDLRRCAGRDEKYVVFAYSTNRLLVTHTTTNLFRGNSILLWKVGRKGALTEFRFEVRIEVRI